MGATQQLLSGGAGNAYRGFTGGTVTDTKVGSTANASVSLFSGGNITTAGSTPAMMTDWYLPNIVGIGSSHWVRATTTGGTGLPTGPIGVWTQLSGSVSWLMQQAPVGSINWSATLELATDAAGANKVATCSITLTATRTS